jgi:hypothetical protein
MVLITSVIFPELLNDSVAVSTLYILVNCFAECNSVFVIYPSISPCHMTAVVCSSYVFQKIAAPMYGIICHGFLVEVVTYFVVQRKEIEFQVTIRGVNRVRREMTVVVLAM